MLDELTDFQQAALGVPFEYDLALLGGRGGGKSTTALTLAYQYAVANPGTRSIYLRQSYPSLHDVLLASVQLFTQLDPGSRLNKSDLHWTFSNLSSMSFAALADWDLYRRWQGSNVALLIADESQQWATPELLDLLLSNLRSSSAQTRAVYCANPGDRGHSWVYERFIKPCPGDGIPFKTDNGRMTVVMRSTYLDNPHLGDDYLDNLRAATKHDPTLFKMWSTGDWSIQGGAFFSEVVSQKNLVILYPSDYWPERRDWRLYLALDWGTAAPAVCLLLALSRESTRTSDGEHHVKGDIIVLDETSTAIPGNLNKGDRSTVGEFSKRVKAMCERWQAPRFGCGDSAIFAEHGHESRSLGHEFIDNGLMIEPAPKGRRVDGWATLRERFSNAEKHGERERPAIYINEHLCPYLWETIRILTPDMRDREDVDTNGPDHGADALRYGVEYRPQPPPSQTSLSIR